MQRSFHTILEICAILEVVTVLKLQELQSFPKWCLFQDVINQPMYRMAIWEITKFYFPKAIFEIGFGKESANTLCHLSILKPLDIVLEVITILGATTIFVLQELQLCSLDWSTLPREVNNIIELHPFIHSFPDSGLAETKLLGNSFVSFSSLIRTTISLEVLRNLLCWSSDTLPHLAEMDNPRVIWVPNFHLWTPDHPKSTPLNFGDKPQLSILQI